MLKGNVTLTSPSEDSDNDELDAGEDVNDNGLLG